MNRDGPDADLSALRLNRYAFFRLLQVACDLCCADCVVCVVHGRTAASCDALCSDVVVTRSAYGVRGRCNLYIQFPPRWGELWPLSAFSAMIKYLSF